MNASDSSSPSRENVSDESVDYEQLGKTLLFRELERHAYGIREEFIAARGKVERGEELDRDDVDALRSELNNAQFLVDEIEEALE